MRDRFERTQFQLRRSQSGGTGRETGGLRAAASDGQRCRHGADGFSHGARRARRRRQQGGQARSADHTLINLGPLALKMRTSSIVLGAADGAGDSPGGPYGPNVSSFAAARESGIYSVAGSAKAALTLSFDLGDYLENAAGRLPIPIGGAGRKFQAAFALEAGGKLSLNVGSSFGFSSSSGAPDKPGGHLSFSTNVLKPWKRTTLRWRYTF